jgi:sigma-B regulation protein RsbU (phosphoserine phosphatase)
MVQTAVRTLLLNDVSDSRTFMNILNRTIYDNVQRMRSDKNLTLSILDYQKGTLSITGQHEEVLLVKKDGSVERIDTFDLGFMVGLEEDISQFVSNLEVKLNEGDGIVLYTDGITEARNQEKDFYSVDRLCAIIEAQWQQPAQAILDSIIKDVSEHIGNDVLQDDITLLVIKQR